MHKGRFGRRCRGNLGHAAAHRHRLHHRRAGLLRFEFLVRFGQAPRLADGMWLRTWKGGPQAGQPKVSPAMRSMLDRGLVTIELVRPGARAYFTDAGYAALRLLAQDHRALNPAQYVHLLKELGLKPAVTAGLEDAAEG